MVDYVFAPKSLFGKKPFSKELWNIFWFTDEVGHGVYFIIPEELSIPTLPIPEEIKKRKGKEWLSRALKRLEDIGV